MQSFTGISWNLQSKSYTLSLTECIWEFQNNALWNTHWYTQLGFRLTCFTHSETFSAGDNKTRIRIGVAYDHSEWTTLDVCVIKSDVYVVHTILPRYKPDCIVTLKNTTK